jgi:hypothetical protein
VRDQVLHPNKETTGKIVALYILIFLFLYTMLRTITKKLAGWKWLILATPVQVIPQMCCQGSLRYALFYAPVRLPLIFTKKCIIQLTLILFILSI